MYIFAQVSNSHTHREKKRRRIQKKYIFSAMFITPFSANVFSVFTVATFILLSSMKERED
jgi:hypothetical protein